MKIYRIRIIVRDEIESLKYKREHFTQDMPTGWIDSIDERIEAFTEALAIIEKYVSK